MKNMTVNRWRILLAIFGIAILLRTLYIVEQKKNPLFTSPISDASYNLDMAEKIMNKPADIPPVFLRSPLYQYFLAALLELFDNNLFSVRFFQAFLDAITVVLLCLIATKLYSWKAGLLTGIIASIYWPLIFYTSELLDTTLFIFLLTSGTYFFILFIEKMDATSDSGKCSWTSYFYIMMSGIFLGGTSLTRVEALLIIVVFGLWLFLKMRHIRLFAHNASQNEVKDIKKSAKKLPINTPFRWLLYFLAPAIITICPATIHNLKKGDDSVLISSRAGLNFYMGNHPRSGGWSVTFTGSKTLDYLEAYNPKELPRKNAKPSQISRYYFLKGLNMILSNPFPSVALFLKKTNPFLQ